MANISNLSPKQKRLLAALLTSKTTREAIAKANIAERTAYRWMQDESFKSALAEAEGQLLSEALRRLLNMQAQAIDALEAILTNPASRQSDRLKAVELALSHVLKLNTAIRVEEKLKALQSVIVELESNRTTTEISNLD
jgi:hypothetical protein